MRLVQEDRRARGDAREVVPASASSVSGDGILAAARILSAASIKRKLRIADIWVVNQSEETKESYKCRFKATLRALAGAHSHQLFISSSNPQSSAAADGCNALALVVIAPLDS